MSHTSCLVAVRNSNGVQDFTPVKVYEKNFSVEIAVQWSALKT